MQFSILFPLHIVSKQDLSTGWLRNSIRLGDHVVTTVYEVAGDVCTIQDVMARSADKGGSFADLLLTIVESDAFQMRRAATTDAVTDDTAGAP